MKYSLNFNLEKDKKEMEVEGLPFICHEIGMGDMGKLILPLFNAPPNESFPGAYLYRETIIPVTTSTRFAGLLFNGGFENILEKDKIANANNCIRATITIKRRKW